ncbi:MAG: hypothetical protein ACFFDS_09050 [Candidatus Thorarchaeota archaeon]
MAIFGFGGAFVLAIVSLIFNFSVSAKPLYFFLKGLITFLIQNIVNLFDKEKTFVKFSLEHPKYEKMYLYVLSGLFIFTGTFLLFFYGFGSLTTAGLVGALLLMTNNIVVTIFSFLGITKSTVMRKITSILFSLSAILTVLLFINKISSETSFILPKFLDWMLVLPAIGYALFQAFFFSGQLNYAYPALIIIPICITLQIEKKIDLPKKDLKPKEETLSKKRKRASVFLDEIEKEADEIEKKPALPFLTFMDNGAKGIYAMLAILLLVFSLQAIGVMSSYGSYTSKNYNPMFSLRPDFDTGVTLTSISYSDAFLFGYETDFQNELDALLELNVSTVKLDVRQEILDNNLTEFKQVMNTLKSNGFKIMLTTYGYSSPKWAYQNISFSEYTSTLEDQAITLLEDCNPEYLIIYPEPFGFSTAYLKEVPTIDTWVTTINNTVNHLHSLSNDTEVGVKLSFNGFSDEYYIFEPLWTNSSLDFLGIDYYIIHERDIEEITDYLDKIIPNEKEFWIIEFGLSAIMYGERVQTGALERMLEICTNDTRVNGFVYFSLTDDTYTINTYGIIAETGHKRLIFFKYKEIIAKIVG